MKELNVMGLTIAPGVIETIISIAAREVDGVAGLGNPVVGGIRGLLSGEGAVGEGIEVKVADDDKLDITLHVTVEYGYALPALADALRRAVADAISIQVGLDVASVDVYVDAVSFKK